MDDALFVLERIYPKAWRDAAKTADFDVIAATLDRLQAAAAGGDWGSAESARLEAYGIFELGPSSGCAGSRPISSRRQRACSGTGRRVTTASFS